MCLASQVTEVYMFFHYFILYLLDPQTQSLPFVSECTGHTLIWPMKPNTFVQGVNHSEVCSFMFRVCLPAYTV